MNKKCYFTCMTEILKSVIDLNLCFDKGYLEVYSTPELAYNFMHPADEWLVEILIPELELIPICKTMVKGINNVDLTSGFSEGCVVQSINRINAVKIHEGLCKKYEVVKEMCCNENNEK